MTDQDSATDQSNRTEDTDQERIEHVERTDVGVSLTVKLKRERDSYQDEVIAKAKGSTLEDARRIQPDSESGEWRPGAVCRRLR